MCVMYYMCYMLDVLLVLDVSSLLIPPGGPRGSLDWPLGPTHTRYTSAAFLHKWNLSEAGRLPVAATINRPDPAPMSFPVLYVLICV